MGSCEARLWPKPIIARNWDDRLHVAFDGEHWWAIGREGSYGGSHTRDVAIRMACDATLTGSYWPGAGKSTIPHGRRAIVVHDPDGSVVFTITQVRGRETPQAFQDDVP